MFKNTFHSLLKSLNEYLPSLFIQYAVINIFLKMFLYLKAVIINQVKDCPEYYNRLKYLTQIKTK